MAATLDCNGSIDGLWFAVPMAMDSLRGSITYRGRFVETPCSSMERAVGRPLFRGAPDLKKCSEFTPKCPKYFRLVNAPVSCCWFFKTAFRSLFQRGGFWPSAGFAECNFGKMWTISNVTLARCYTKLLVTLFGWALPKAFSPRTRETAHLDFKRLRRTWSHLLVNHASRLLAGFESHQGIWLVVYGRLRLLKAPCWLPAATTTRPWPLRLAWHAVGSFLLICESPWYFLLGMFFWSTSSHFAIVVLCLWDT